MYIYKDFNAVQISFVMSKFNQKWVRASFDSTTKETLLSILGTFGFYETSTFCAQKENLFWG